MNKRIKKKREWLDLLNLVAQLQRVNDLQQEVIEAYGNQLAQVKRELADLRTVVERSALADNNRFDHLETENKELWQEIENLKRSQKKSFFKRK